MRIIDMSGYIPTQGMSVEELGVQLGFKPAEAKMYRRVHGFSSVSFAHQETIGELLAKVVEPLRDRYLEEWKHVTHVIFCHTILNVSPIGDKNWSDNLRPLFAPGTNFISFTMTHCASSIVALGFAQKLLSNGARRVLILCGEKSFAPTVTCIAGTSLLGEASVAVLLAAEGKGVRVGQVEILVDGRFSVMDREADAAMMRLFQNCYSHNLTVAMARCVTKNSISFAEVKRVLPHNVNTSSWEKYCQIQGLPKEKIYLSNVARIGHCFGADVYLNMLSAVRDGAIQDGDFIMLVSAGLGATIAGVVCECAELDRFVGIVGS